MAFTKLFLFYTLVVYSVIGSPVPEETQIQPLHYQVTFKVSADKLAFTGEETIKARALKVTDSLELGAPELDISSVNVYDPEKPQQELVASYRTEGGALKVILQSPLQKNVDYLVHVQFSGHFEGGMTFERLFDQKEHGNAYPKWEDSDSEATYEVNIVLSEARKQFEDDPVTSSTAAPATSSAAPATSSAAPDTSSAAPATSSAAPDTSTAAPETSSAAPATSSAAPDTSSAAPATSSAAPDTSTAAPPSSTDAPPSSTNGPSSSTDAPPSSTNGPSSSTDAPPSSTNGPSSSTDAPPSSTNGPSSSTDAPSSSTDAPPSTTAGTSTTEDDSAAPSNVVSTTLIACVAMLAVSLR